MYDNVRKAEVDNKEILLNYQDEKPGVVNKDNVNDILNVLRKKKKK